MNVFCFSPESYHDEYETNGFVHVKGGVSPEFLAYAQQTAYDLIAAEKSLEEWNFKGKKQQFLMEFPDDSDFPRGVKETVARVAGLPADKMTLCERHIKAYEEVANNNPPPHKDRVASQVTVGLPLKVPNGSYIILYPHDYLTINPLNSTALWRTSLDEDQLPENVLRGIEPVRLDVQPGDVVLFRGSSIYHERVNPSNTILLYLKFNAMGLDPLGEDPDTPVLRERTLGCLSDLSDEDLLDMPVAVSPRLERISRHYTRLYWKEVVQAYVSGEKEFTLSEAELRIFQVIDGGRTVREVIARLGIPEPEYLGLVPTFRRLGRLGGIDFLAA